MERMFYCCLHDIIPFYIYSMCRNVMRFHSSVLSVQSLVDLYIFCSFIVVLNLTPQLQRCVYVEWKFA